MGGLIKETLDALGRADKEYGDAIDDLEDVNTELGIFNRDLRSMLNTDHANHKRWVDTVRASTYSGTGALTIGMIIADIFGCLGICSAVGNVVGWGTAVGAVEGSIAK